MVLYNDDINEKWVHMCVYYALQILQMITRWKRRVFYESRK